MTHQGVETPVWEPMSQPNTRSRTIQAGVTTTPNGSVIMKSYYMTIICLIFACCLLAVMLYMEKGDYCGSGLSSKIFATRSAMYPIPISKKLSVKKNFNSTKDTSQIKLSGCGSCNGIHKLSWEEPYRSRLLHVQEQCKKKPQQNYSLLSSYYKFSDKLKLIMCETPKVASTSLQKLLVKLDSSFKERDSWTYQHTCGQWGNNCFTELTKEEARLRVSTYTSFLTTRHPLDRVVSAYIDKLKRSNLSFRRWFGIPVALHQASLYLHGVGSGDDLLKMKTKEIKSLKLFQRLPPSHKHDVLKYIKVMRTGSISFPQFVRFLVEHYVDEKINQMDRHWKPQVDICQPCAFNYSYIIAFNELAKDANRILDYLVDYQKLNFSKENIHITMRNTRVGHNSVAAEYYKQVPENHVQILRDMYKDDFTFFDYDPYLYHGYS